MRVQRDEISGSSIVSTRRYFESINADVPSEPQSHLVKGELDLLLAILHQAVLDVISIGNTRNFSDAIRADAIEWFKSDDESSPSSGHVTYIYVCQSLGIEHTGLRRAILSGRFDKRLRWVRKERGGGGKRESK